MQREALFVRVVRSLAIGGALGYFTMWVLGFLRGVAHRFEAQQGFVPYVVPRPEPVGLWVALFASVALLLTPLPARGRNPATVVRAASLTAGAGYLLTVLIGMDPVEFDQGHAALLSVLLFPALTLAGWRPLGPTGPDVPAWRPLAEYAAVATAAYLAAFLVSAPLAGLRWHPGHAAEFVMFLLGPLGVIWLLAGALALRPNPAPA